MERRGWVVRTRSQTDRRRNHLSLTETGKIELDKLAELMMASESRALATLTNEERDVISGALDKTYKACIRPAPGD